MNALTLPSLNCDNAAKAGKKAKPFNMMQLIRGLYRAVFSAKVSTAVAIVCVAAMWWHIATLTNAEAHQAVGLDALIALPWAIVWAIRASRMPIPEEGGDK